MPRFLSIRSLFKKSASPSKNTSDTDNSDNGEKQQGNQWTDCKLTILTLDQIVGAVNVLNFLAIDLANIIAEYAIFPQWLLRYDLSSLRSQEHTNHRVIQETISSKTKNNILFENTIKFTDNLTVHILRFVFYQRHIQHLAKANDCDEFSNVVELMYTTCGLNDHFMKISPNDQKQVDGKKKYLEQLYDSWVHRLGPKYVADNLNELTKFTQ